MPVRNGRWVTWASLEKPKADPKVIVPADPTPPQEKATVRKRRTTMAAVAAIADATGVTVDETEQEETSE